MPLSMFTKKCSCIKLASGHVKSNMPFILKPQPWLLW